GPLINGSVMSHGARVDVDDAGGGVVDGEAASAGDLPDDGGADLPARGDGEKVRQLVRGEDRHHPLLRFRHEDFFGAELFAQRNLLKVDVHAALTIGSKLCGGARDAGCTEVLDALNEVGSEAFEAASDDALLLQRVTDLHSGALSVV